MSRASPRPVPETRRGTRSPHTSPACLPSSVRRLRPQSWQAPKCPVQAGAGATPGDTQPTHRPVPGAQHVGAEDTQHGAPLTSPPTTPRRAPRDDFPAAGLPVNRSRSGLAFSLACPEFGPTRWEYRPFTSVGAQHSAAPFLCSGRFQGPPVGSAYFQPCSPAAERANVSKFNSDHIIALLKSLLWVSPQSQVQSPF